MLSSLLAAGFIVFVGLLSAGWIYEVRSRQRDAKRFPPPGQLVDVGGRRLHLLLRGTGPTVVIEQGAGGPSLNWFPLLEQIAQFARVCLYDRAGSQWSDAVAGPRSLEDRVEDLHRLLTKADIPGPYVFVAHSFGGFLARLFALKYPGSVAGLVLVDTPHEESYYQRLVVSRYAKFKWVLRIMAVLARFGVPRLLNRLVGKPDPNVPPELSPQLNAAMVRREYFAAASDDIACLEREALGLAKTGALGTLGNLPVVVITHGKPFPGPFAVLEKFWREGQDKLAALSTNGRVVVAVNSNHMIHNDEPEVVVDAIRSVVEAVRK